ncbi:MULTISPECIES: hypothetical protein [unclassified Nocardioides]|uniref:hypothetical protein n=1 Tax=unclassified Nocardioides TaxID=2615069 RepID=UPI00138EC924|nr:MULTISPECIES: hypothetical protein [unclassified Nocardioides]
MSQPTTTPDPGAPRRKHLMDPNAPRKAPDPQALERLARVQRRVVSVLAITTVLHLSAGLVIAADHVGKDRLDAQLTLLTIATIFMVGGIAATLVINHRKWLSPWLLIGLTPGLVGLWWIVL